MYRAPINDMRVAFDHMVDAGRLAATERFAEATRETRDAALTEAARLAETVIAPLNRVGDTEGSRLENGVVRTPTGFREAYAELSAGGWIGMAADPEYGGMGLPVTHLCAVNEMLSSSCLSLSLSPLMSQGAIETLEHFGTPEQKAIYLPKMISANGPDQCASPSRRPARMSARYGPRPSRRATARTASPEARSGSLGAITT